MISRVLRGRCEIVSERISSVMTPPALRITCASPSSSPRILWTSRRASMQATSAHALSRGQRQVALVERLGVGHVVLQQLVGDAHPVVPSSVSGGAYSRTIRAALHTRPSMGDFGHLAVACLAIARSR